MVMLSSTKDSFRILSVLFRQILIKIVCTLTAFMFACLCDVCITFVCVSLCGMSLYGVIVRERESKSK